MHVFRLGSSREFLEVVLPPEIKSQNWAKASVNLAVEGFVGNLQTFFDKDDFSEFLRQLKELNRTLLGKAKLEPLDQQCMLCLSVDARGHLKIEGEASSRVSSGNRLTFEFELDQSYLPEPLGQVEAIVQNWTEE